MQVIVNGARWVQFPQGNKNLSETRRPFCVALSAVLSVIFCFLDFVSGYLAPPCADRVLTLNMSIWLPLFWSSWSRALGPDSATCAGLEHGRDYSYCKASAQKRQKGLSHCFCKNYQKYLKNSDPCCWVFNPQLSDWYRLQMDLSQGVSQWLHMIQNFTTVQSQQLQHEEPCWSLLQAWILHLSAGSEPAERLSMLFLWICVV